MKPKNILYIFSLLLLISNVAISANQTNSKPNVILIITDDQGFGDLGYNGNPHIKTPVLDAFAAESIRFNEFCVSPVCAPTRASLMTGRYSLRTGVRDTYNGGATMASNEITIAEMLHEAGYATGIFGKWHLGDNYPSRPNDQGFDESLIHLSGGMGQVGDFTTWFRNDSSYFDPVLWHNGKTQPYKGYCTDIFAGEAIRFIENNRKTPFFCYLAFNAPHTPLQVPGKYYDRYKNIDPAAGFKNIAIPEMNEKDKEDARKVYAMVSCIDENLGRLFKKLDELEIADNTIVIFMTDNGPQQRRYVAGMKGLKSSVYRGGVRVPFYFRYSAGFTGNRNVETTAAHIDVLPTIAEVCGVQMPTDRVIDGKSLVPLLKGETVNWNNRPLFVYWTRRFPELYNNMAVVSGNEKLVAHANYDAKPADFELYNLKDDPFENSSIANPEVAGKLKNQLDRLYHELITSENLVNPPRIGIGSDHENPVFLNRNDADGERGIWDQEEVYGKWRVSITEGFYHVKFRFLNPVPAGGRMYLETGQVVNQMVNNVGITDLIEMKNVKLPALDCDLIPFYQVKNKSILPFYVEIEKIK